MSYTYEQLHEMTVAQLREIAQGVQHDAVKGFSTMHKEKLLPALCHALGIEAHTHHVAVGINKSAIKTQIRKLKVDREAALTAKNYEQLKDVRHKIKMLKKKLRKAIV
jgi:protein-arginine kinase activator protein McsA